jgi:hypothetical protein
MSGNGLTIIVGIAGVLVSVLCAFLAFRMGVRQADRQTAELLTESSRQNAQVIAVTNGQKLELAREMRQVRGAFSSFFQQVVRGSPSTNKESATEVLVRASLGVLLDEHGEVRLQRLLDDVAAAAKTPSQSETLSVLRRMREEGVVDWSGPADLMNVKFVRVRSPGERMRRGAPTAHVGKARA